MQTQIEMHYSNSQSQVNKNEDKAFINSCKIVNDWSRLSIPEKEITFEEKKVTEEASLRKSSLRAARSNQFASLMKEIIAHSQYLANQM